MPDDDGGDRIKGYVIEKKTIDGKAWTKVNPNCGSTSFVVPDLISEQQYFFRVRAENRFGIGPPVETIQRTTARDPICKSSSRHLNICSKQKDLVNDN